MEQDSEEIVKISIKISVICFRETSLGSFAFEKIKNKNSETKKTSGRFNRYE